MSIPASTAPAPTAACPEAISDSTTAAAARQTCAFRFPSAQACLEYFRTWYGPTVAAFGAVGEAGRAQLEADLVAVFEGHGTATDGTLAMGVSYLEVVGGRS